MSKYGQSDADLYKYTRPRPEAPKGEDAATRATRATARVLFWPLGALGKGLFHIYTPFGNGPINRRW